MSNEDHQDLKRNLRERIASQIHATSLARHKQLTTEELQKLETAVSRLDQLLSAATDADRQVLQTAAARLDQLLVDIAKGKDVIPEFKRRQATQTEQR